MNLESLQMLMSIIDWQVVWFLRGKVSILFLLVYTNIIVCDISIFVATTINKALDFFSILGNCLWFITYSREICSRKINTRKMWIIGTL